MSSDKVTVLCGSCKVPVDGPSNPASHDVLSCPKCGRSDQLSDVMVWVKKYTTDKMADYMAKGFERSARSSSGFTYKRGPRHVGEYRYITNMQL